MKLIVFSYVIFICLIPLVTCAQGDSTASDTTITQAVDSLTTARKDTLQSDSAKVIFKVYPWKYHAPLGARKTATDSTLRWQVWPSWTYKKNRDPGVISYRLGTIGRTNALQINDQEPKYQALYWEDIKLNDPVSGIVNWNYIPHHKVENLYENDLGTVDRTKFYLKDYYLNKPLTQLNYTQSSFDTRNLQFVASENFSQKTNAEISYWDRRDGGEYNNSGIVGRQIFARLSHQIDERQFVKAKFFNNNYDNNLPFGYVIPNPGTFNFNRFTTTAREPNGAAERNSAILAFNYYRRPADTSRTTSRLNAGFFVNAVKRKVTYSADTTNYKVRQLGATIRKWKKLGPFKLEGGSSLSYFFNSNEETSSLKTNGWGLITADGKASWPITPSLQINGQGNFRGRTDGYSDFRLGATAKFAFTNRLNFSAGYVSGSRIPTPQQLYWQSRQFQGNADLRNENINQLHANINYATSPTSAVGVRAALKQIDRGIRVAPDSTFTNGNAYTALAATAFYKTDQKHYELSASATLQQFGSFLKTRRQPIPVDETQHIWLKGSAYVKGYLFSHATYVKFGAAGVFSPQAYSSARYYPSLDFWQSSDNEFIPSFNRLDIDFSARVRSIMILLRYENVLDQLTQQGYFETNGYPMMQRRFIFGLRVLLRD